MSMPAWLLAAQSGALDRAAARGIDWRAEGVAMFKGFKQFILRGNVIDLAVAVVMGAAFGTVVNAFVAGLLSPLIAAVES